MVELGNKMRESMISTIFSGGTASVIQITSTYWLRTNIKYQYRHGTSPIESLKKLILDKDKFRLYRGFIPTLIKGSIGKTGEVVSYTYFKKYTDINDNLKIVGASITSSILRFNLMPFDNVTNIYQVHGKNGLDILKKKYKNNGFKIFYTGTAVYFLNNFIGNMIWFSVFDIMNSLLFLNGVYKERNNERNKYKDEYKDIKNLCIGFTCSATTDLITNPLRVIKTYRQSDENNISYNRAIKNILREKGLKNYLVRGLTSRILLGGLNSAIFVFLWKRIDEN